MHYTRYADVVVHRLLAAAIGVGPLPPQLEHKGGLHDLAENMNRRHRSAQLAGRASVQLHTQLYFKDHPAVNEKVHVKLQGRRRREEEEGRSCCCCFNVLVLVHSS
jgi:exosome complex exonuclease DIS3/RRP44